MSENHTPTPWAKWQSPDGDWFARAVYANAEGRRCTAWPAHCAAGGQDNEANAELIVTAVNSYASSQAEIEKLRTLVSECVKQLDMIIERGEPTDFIQWRAELADALSGSKE